VVGAYHREWAPGIRTLALAGRLVNDQHVSDRAVNLPVLSYNNGQLASVSSSDFDVRYRNELEIYTGELQQVFQTSRSTLLLGGRVQAGQFTTDNSLSNLYFPAFFPSNYATVDEDLWRWSAYAYETFEVLPSRLWLTAGLSYDVVEYPENYRQVPVSSGQARDSRWGPKAAAVWSPAPSTTVRAAYTRSLGGVSLEESYRLEPSQLAGFIQSYRTIIPESVVGSVAAPTFDTFGVALDLQPASRTYVGLVAEMLSSDVDRELGAYGYPDSSGRAYGSSMTQSLDYDEYAAGLVVNQLLSRAWSLGAAYRWTRAQLDQSLPDVPLATYPGGRSSQTSDLHTVRLHALFNHPSGFFARVEADYYAQQNLQDTYDTAGIATTRSLPDDSFWQVNLWAGWRLRQARGDLAIGVLNVADQDYHLNPLNLHAELPRERVLAARLRLRF
jgi:outer membrane receptor protein involved in Fe transport